LDFATTLLYLNIVQGTESLEMIMRSKGVKDFKGDGSGTLESNMLQLN
jgi:hypothetical protein